MRIIVLSAALSALIAANPARSQEWAGFYAGLHVGYGWADSDSVLVGTNEPGSGAIAEMDELGLATRLSTDDGSTLGGAQAGFNFQSGNFVWGIEADISRLDASGSGTSSITDDDDIFANSARSDLDWLGTVRLRAGALLNARSLVYVTGGLAYGRIDSSYTSSDVDDDPGAIARIALSASDESWEAGWTIGGGAEFKIVEGVSLRGEYLYYDLGDTEAAVTLHPDIDTRFGFKVDSENTGHAVRAALNFQVGQ